MKHLTTIVIMLELMRISDEHKRRYRAISLIDTYGFDNLFRAIAAIKSLPYLFSEFI